MSRWDLNVQLHHEGVTADAAVQCFPTHAFLLAPMTIPSELHGAIVDALATKANPHAYGWDPVTKCTLIQLCLTSRTLQHFASPHLYSSIIISTAHQLHSLVHSLRTTDGRLSQHVHALSLRDFDDALDESNTDELIELIRLMQHRTTFQRLILDRKLRIDSCILVEDSLIGRLRGPLRAALAALPNLQELNSIQDEVYVAGGSAAWNNNSGWKEHRNLLRLTLYNLMIDSDFVETFANHPNLRHVVLVRPYIDSDNLDEVFQALHPWSRIVLVGSEEARQNWQNQIIKAAATSLAPGWELVYVRAQLAVGDDDEHLKRRVQLWVRARLETGEMYNAEGIVLSANK